MMNEQTRSPSDTDSDLLTERIVSFGMAILALALLAVLTGLVLLPFYHATAPGAHRSVQAIQAHPGLRLVRAAHHWGSALLILMGAAYLAYSVFISTHRRPYHLLWTAAVGLFLLFFAFQLTGHLLPWDSLAVSSAAIETGIAENVPVVGPMQARLVRGGDAVSPETLHLWYTAHVALLPLALLAAAGLFLFETRRLQALHRVRTAPIVGLLAVLALATVAAPVPLGPPATPEDYGSFAAPPEWYVLPMHGLLNVAQGLHRDFGFLGSVVVPGLTVLLLLLLPWLDRRHAHEPAQGHLRAAVVLGVVAVLTLGLMNAGHMAPLFHAEKVDPLSTEPGRVVNLAPALVRKGQTLYEKNGCGGCHAVAGKGGRSGPPLDGEGRKRPDLDWQVRHLQNPAAVVSGSTMPPFKHLKEEELKALASYLLSLK
jgi:quinol-cytochrome oxidoreductase complex cytochrome b subunit